MAFDEEFKADALPDLYAEFGRTVTYIPSGAASFPVQVLRRGDPGPAATKSNAAGTTGYPTSLRVQKSEVSQPQRNADQIEIPASWLRAGSAKTVRVAEVIDAGGGEWELRLASATR